MLVLGTQNNICVLLLSICVRINFWGWKIPISALVLPVFWAFPVLGPIITSLASSRSNTDGPFGPEMPKKRVKRGGNGYFYPQKSIRTKIEKSSTHNCLFLTESNSFISLYASSGKSSNCFLTYAILYATTFPPLLSTFPPLLSTFPPLLFRFLHYFLILIPSSVVTNLM